jgi:hypothetical protein
MTADDTEAAGAAALAEEATATVVSAVGTSGAGFFRLHPMTASAQNEATPKGVYAFIFVLEARMIDVNRDCRLNFH